MLFPTVDKVIGKFDKTISTLDKLNTKHQKRKEQAEAVVNYHKQSATKAEKFANNLRKLFD